MTDKNKKGDSITFFKNCCPKCNSVNITLITTEDEETKMHCTECDSIFEISESKKTQVGDAREI